MNDRQRLTLKFFQKNHLLHMGNPLYKKPVYELFQWMLSQDNTEKDKTSLILPKQNIKAKIICRENIVVAGLEEVSDFFKNFIFFDIKISDGKKARKNEVIVMLSAEARILLSLERTILNVLQRMCGIATQTNLFVDKIKEPFIAATRKTPWMLLDKKAVAVGGGITHRLNLNDGMLIKDNHLEVIKKKFGLVNEEEAVTKVLAVMWPQDDNNNIEIEVNTPKGAIAAIKTFMSIKIENYLTIMFDNWQPKDVKKIIAEQKIPADISRRILFEASGNITEENINEWAKTQVDFLSMGSLTHSAKSADLSMEII